MIDAGLDMFLASWEMVPLQPFRSVLRRFVHCCARATKRFRGDDPQANAPQNN